MAGGRDRGYAAGRDGPAALRAHERRGRATEPGAGRLRPAGGLAGQRQREGLAGRPEGEPRPPLWHRTASRHDAGGGHGFLFPQDAADEAADPKVLRRGRQRRERERSVRPVAWRVGGHHGPAGDDGDRLLPQRQGRHRAAALGERRGAGGPGGLSAPASTPLHRLRRRGRRKEVRVLRLQEVRGRSHGVRGADGGHRAAEWRGDPGGQHRAGRAGPAGGTGGGRAVAADAAGRMSGGGHDGGGLPAGADAHPLLQAGRVPAGHTQKREYAGAVLGQQRP